MVLGQLPLRKITPSNLILILTLIQTTLILTEGNFTRGNCPDSKENMLILNTCSFQNKVFSNLTWCILI